MIYSFQNRYFINNNLNISQKNIEIVGYHNYVKLVSNYKQNVYACIYIHVFMNISICVYIYIYIYIYIFKTVQMKYVDY